MRLKILFVFIFLMMCFQASLFGRSSNRDNMIREYPDGSFGMDMGGGYETAPLGPNDKEDVLMPAAYRDNYVKTKFGPMTQKGFVFFPDFEFSGTQKKEKREEREIDQEKEEKDYIFQVNGDNTTINSAQMSPIWGVYIPPENKKSE